MEIMISCYVLVIVFLRDVHGVTQDKNCDDKPVITPPRLVVKHGDPTSATCSVCRSCQNDTIGLEKALGYNTINGTTILWTVKSMSEWDTSATCYHTTADDIQCVTRLPVTVYKPPDNVSIGFTNHSGPMVDARQYTLWCRVLNVAPVGNLTVTFYRGQTALGPGQSSGFTDKKPASDVFMLSINASKEDNGVQYWCKAELQLGPEGPQRPPVVHSEILTAAVHYKPEHPGSTRLNTITVTAGDPLQLSCEAKGNPAPSYNWTLLPASLPPSNGSVLAITSAASEHGGRYACSASNAVGAATVTFDVVVKPYIIPYIIGVAVAVLLAVIIAAVCLYQRNKTGVYNFLKRNKPHVAVPTADGV